MTYIAYLDEFGHIGPYISRNDRQHNDSPVFGLAGLVLPIEEVRSFGTWFYQRKCELLKFELDRSDAHPSVWEKKGSSLYTVRNVRKYRELRNFTNRLLNKIDALGGFVFYVGQGKHASPEDHDANALYRYILREAIKRIDQYCMDDCDPCGQFLLALDEHDQRSALVTQAAIAMYGADRRRSLVEPPFQLESHRYQTMQAADWIAGLTGRLGAYWKASEEYPENEIFATYFAARLHQCAVRSGIRD
ncbi:DUF3800 domain-containing protein [Phaeobacter sp. QD34_3]|uniref:DUF3800 domain-containing protein n=1 Tax=unclassified Phaeobacter TaxID=2621772 RepID=UPI00237F41F4|nr:MULTISPECIES: DUF3800 domain-containing protein [unclassified Phaeobacter]MDE4132762.1 DUF3800 domain-containing protein [Phaeobacter sp. QD34_3]MDE4136445.1 DUF3800 domain-containing protein [Phaeobacter sp. QD34_24]